MWNYASFLNLFVTDSLFKQLIKLRYLIIVESTDKEVDLSFEEQCCMLRSMICYQVKLKRSQSK